MYRAHQTCMPQRRDQQHGHYVRVAARVLLWRKLADPVARNEGTLVAQVVVSARGSTVVARAVAKVVVGIVGPALVAQVIVSARDLVPQVVV